MKSTTEIIDTLTWFSRTFPEETLIEAMQKQDEITPALLESLDYMADNAVRLMNEADGSDDEPFYFLHEYAMYLLAQFKEKRAFPKLVRLMHFDDPTVDFIMSDTLTERYPAILRDTYDGNIALLKAVIEDAGADEFVRDAALRAYRLISQAGHISRTEALAYYQKLLKSGRDAVPDADEDDKNAISFLTHLTNTVADHHMVEMIDDIKALYDGELIFTDISGDYDDFIDSLFDEKNDTDEHDAPVTDAIADMRWWACFDRQKTAQRQQAKRLANFSNFSVTAPHKPGRNDPCPCGSGKKYKKCCLNKPADPNKDPWEVLDENGMPYNLLKCYPNSPAFADCFSAVAIKIDTLVYKALHTRMIFFLARRDPKQEDLGRIHFLLEAFDLFQKRCAEEHFTTFDAFDKKYMIHYASAYWMEAFEDLLKTYQEGLPFDWLKVLPVVSQVRRTMDSIID